MGNDKVTIIVPTYNCEQYLTNALDSIHAQSYSNWECIIIDDGSTDETRTIVDRYCQNDNRFIYIYQDNQGPSAARNKGIEHASGEIITFVDSDDWIASNYCECIVKNIAGVDELLFPINIVYPNGMQSCITPPKGEYIGKVQIENAINLLHEEIPGDIFGWTVNKAHRRSTLEISHTRFPEGICHFEDEVFALRHYKHINSLRIITESLYYYRYLPTSLTFKGKTAESLSTAARLLSEELSGYSNEKMLSSFVHQIHSFYKEAASKDKRFFRIKELKEFYLTHTDTLSDIKINKRNKILYSLPDFPARFLYSILKILKKI